MRFTTNAGGALPLYRYSIAFVFLLLACYFISLAASLSLHYYDSYEYLNSAKAMVGFDSYYDFTRPPVFIMLFMPLMAAYKFSGNPWFLTSSPYFLMVVIAAAALFICYRAFAAWLGREVALALTLLLALSRAFFHFAPFVLPDIFATGLFVAFLYYCYRVTESGRNLQAVYAGLLLGLAVSTKHYLAPICLIPALFLVYDWRRPNSSSAGRYAQLRWLAIMALVSAGLTLALHRIGFWLVPEYRNQPLISILTSTVESGTRINGLLSAAASLRFNTLHTVNLLAAALGWPLLLLAVAGIVMGLRRRTHLDVLMLIALVVFLPIFILLFAHRETRYFLQITPVILYFVGVVAVAFKDSWSTLVSVRRYLALSVAALAIGMLLVGTQAEVKSFTDPVYYSDAPQRLAAEIERRTQPGNKVIWVRDLLFLAPEQFKLIEDSPYDDPYYYTLGSHANAITYYANRRAYTLFPFKIAPFLKTPLQPGDLIVVGQPALIVQPPFPPLSIHAFNGYSLFGVESGPQGERWTLKAQNGDQRIGVRKTPQGLVLEERLSQPMLAWEMLVKDGSNYWLNAYPVLSTPAEIALPADFNAAQLQGLVTVPLNQPLMLFYY